MLYQLDMAAIEGTLAKQAKQAGVPLDPRIANAPELEQGLQLYLQAFFDLNTERQTGFGLGPISGSSIRAYASDYDFDEEQTDALSFYVSKMDTAFLARQNAKQDAKVNIQKNG